MKKLIFLFVILFTINVNAADIYWVDDNGAETTWADCENDNPMSGTAACTLATANTNAVAGDTINLRGGTYTSRAHRIEPTNSGTSGNLITYQAYNGEAVEFAAELVTNRTMELDSNWNAEGTPTTEEQSATQAYDGTYSWRFTVDATDEGIKSDTFTSESVGYQYSVWVYPDDSTSVNIYIEDGDGLGAAVDTDHSGLIQDQWNIVSGSVTLAAGSSAYFSVRAPTGTSSGTWYVDNPTIVFNAIYGIDLDDDDYIKIDGITIRDWSRIASIDNDSDYNEITNCTFGPGRGTIIGGPVTMKDGCDYNWIHNNTFKETGRADPETCEDAGNVFTIGGSSAGDNDCYYNLIEDNDFHFGSHHTFKTFCKWNTIRNNKVYNAVAGTTGWFPNHSWAACPNDPSGDFGNRGMIISEDEDVEDAGWCLVEGNMVGPSGVPPDDDGGHGIVTISEGNIIRYNNIHSTAAAAIYMKSLGTTEAHSENNRIYNNSFYKAAQQAVSLGGEIREDWSVGILIGYGGTANTGNIIKNNLGYDYTNDFYSCSSDCTNYETLNTFSNNYEGDTSGNPLFVDTDVSDETSLTKPDLSLQSSSGAINNGTYLTEANGSGSASATLIVDDASYFQDGSWAPPGKIDADYIAIGTVTNTVQISSIDYSADTITLASNMTWSDNDDIWLYKKSDGEVVLYGSAPDQGAYESLAVNLSISIGSGNKTMTVGGGSQSISIGQ